MLFGSQCPGRDFAFSIRHPSGNVGILLDADNKEIRRRWVVAISYQVALNWPDVNFPPFDYGPPIENEGLSRVLICGELQKRGHMVKNWKTRFFQLTPRELQYFEKENLKGKVSVEDATVEFDDRSLEFTLHSSSGADLVMRADSATTKATWVRAIQRQIQSLKDSKQSPQVLTEKEIEEVKIANKERAAKLEEERLQRQLESQNAAKAATEPAKEEPVKDEVVAELSEVIAESMRIDRTHTIVEAGEAEAAATVAFNAESTAAEEEERHLKEMEAALAAQQAAASAAAVAEVETITEEEDEKEDLIDPYLQYGGAYYDDPKNTADFSYIQYNEMPKFTSSHCGMVVRHLTPAVFNKLKGLKTSKGYTLSNVIMSGVLSPPLEIGVTAGDEESWELFKDLLVPIVNDWHGVEVGSMDNTTDLDATKLIVDEATSALLQSAVVSTKIYAIRNISGYSLPCGTTDSERAAVEQALQSVVTSLPSDQAGTYYPLSSIDASLADELSSKKLLFEIPSATSKLNTAGGARSWPNNRGIFVDPSSTIAAWINEEDHFRIITQQEGGDIAATFARFASFMLAVTSTAEAKGLKFMHSSTLGYLCTCPSELGTALKVTMTIHLPEVNKVMQGKKKADLDNIVKVCDIFTIDVDGANGLLSAAEGDNFFVSNSQRLGCTEVDLTQKVVNGAAKLIEIDRLLAKGLNAAAISAYIDNGFKEAATPSPDAGKAATNAPFGAKVQYRDPRLIGGMPRQASVRLDGPAIPKNAESFSPAKLKPSRANRAMEARVDAPPEEDEFGMIKVEIEIDAALEARMSKHLLKAAKEKRSSFVLKQVAKHEKYFEDNGIAKDAPSLGQKKVSLGLSIGLALPIQVTYVFFAHDYRSTRSSRPAHRRWRIPRRKSDTR
jgi:creatine kinase